MRALNLDAGPEEAVPGEEAFEQLKGLEAPEVAPEVAKLRLRVPGLTSFDLDFQPGLNTKPTKISQGSMGRGIPGSKGLRGSRVTGRCGGMGLIRKYGIMMKRQEFREKALQMGWNKYR